MQVNPFDIFKNAQKIQEQMGTFQQKLGGITVTGSAGGGMVEIDLTGKIDVLAVRIAPGAIENGDIEMLQDMITAAFSSAIEKVQEAVNQEMGAMAGGLGIPGMGNLAGIFSGFPGAGA